MFGLTGGGWAAGLWRCRLLVLSKSISRAKQRLGHWSSGSFQCVSPQPGSPLIVLPPKSSRQLDGGKPCYGGATASLCLPHQKAQEKAAWPCCAYYIQGKKKNFFFPLSCLGFDLGICRLGFERDLMLASEMSGIVLSIPEHSYEKVKKTLFK